MTGTGCSWERATKKKYHEQRRCECQHEQRVIHARQELAHRDWFVFGAFLAGSLIWILAAHEEQSTTVVRQAVVRGLLPENPNQASQKDRLGNEHGEQQDSQSGLQFKARLILTFCGW